MIRRTIFALAFLAAACGQGGPSNAQDGEPFASTGAEIADCVGALAALAKIDPVTRVGWAGNSLEKDFNAWLAAHTKETPSLSEKARLAEINAARLRWAARTDAEQKARVRACRTKFMGE